jgi:hypothetical protein
MSNYYYRDNEGNWFIKHGQKLYPVEFSGSMEIAFKMGKIAAIDQIREEMSAYTMSVKNSPMGRVDESTV